MRGPSCSWQEEEELWPGKPDFRLLPIFPACTHPALSALRVSQRKFSSALGVQGRRSPRGRSGRVVQLNRLLQRGRKAKEGSSKGESSGGKVQTKGKRGAKGRQVGKWPTKRLKIYLHQTGETENKDSLPSDGEGKKRSYV